MKNSKVVNCKGGSRILEWVGSPGKADKNIPQGGQKLLSAKEWGDIKSIQGEDPDVLFSPIMQKAFDAILCDYKPYHKIALFGLCTATRPYSLSRKWKRYLEEFETYADLIICSNGGIIPIEYECEYPYLNYDAHGKKKYDKIYIEVGIKRLRQFLTIHRYDYALFNFRHNMRNFHIASTVGAELKDAGIIRDFAILPSEEQYRISQSEGFAKAGFKIYPELWPTMFDPVKEKLQHWTNIIQGRL